MFSVLSGAIPMYYYTCSDFKLRDPNHFFAARLGHQRRQSPSIASYTERLAKRIRHSTLKTFAKSSETDTFNRDSDVADFDVTGEDDKSEKFAGLAWIRQTEKELRSAEAEARNAELEAEAAQQTEADRQAWLQGRVKEIAAQPAVDETGPAFAPFLTQLQQAAGSGSPSSAEDVIAAMIEAGVAPGPRAYHGLVFSYVKAGDANGALDAIRREYNSGVQPLPESYAILIFAFLTSQRVSEAEAIYASMTRAGVPQHAGWVMLCTQLFAQGFPDVALQYYEAGLKEGMLPNEAMYEQMIKHACDTGDTDQASAWIYEMQTLEHAVPDARHYLPYIYSVGCAGDDEEVREAIWAWDDYACANNKPRPTAEAYNLAILGLLEASKDRDAEVDFEVDDEVLELYDDMFNLGIPPNARTHALMFESRVFIEEAEMSELILYFASFRRAGLSMCDISPEALTWYLARLTTEDEVEQLARVVKAMADDNCPVPLQCLTPMGNGCSIFIYWLNSRLSRLKARSQKPKDGIKARAAELAENEDKVEEVWDWVEVKDEDGKRREYALVARIGVGDCVVDEDGYVIPVSKMKTEQLVAECGAKGLPTDGKKAELTKRVTQARKSAPAQIQAAMKRKVAKRASKDDKKDKKDREEMEVNTNTLQSYTSGFVVKEEVVDDRAALAKMLLEDSEADLAEIMGAGKELADDADDGGDVEEEELDFKVRPTEVVLDDDDEDELTFDFKVDTAKLTEAMREQLEDADDPDLEEFFEDMQMDGSWSEEASMASGRMSARGNVETGGAVGDEEEREEEEEWMVAKAEEGALGLEFALDIVRDVQRMDGELLPQDYKTLVKAATAEGNAEASRFMSTLIPATEDMLDPAERRALFHACIQVCLEADELRLAEATVRDMLEAELLPDPSLIQRVEAAQLREKLRQGDAELLKE